MIIGIITKYKESYNYAVQHYTGNNQLVWIKNEQAIISANIEAAIFYFVEPDNITRITAHVTVKKIEVLANMIPEPNYHIPDLEKFLLVRALNKTKGNIEWSSDLIGVSPRTPYRWCEEHQIDVRYFRN